MNKVAYVVTETSLYAGSSTLLQYMKSIYEGKVDFYKLNHDNVNSNAFNVANLDLDKLHNYDTIIITPIVVMKFKEGLIPYYELVTKLKDKHIVFIIHGPLYGLSSDIISKLKDMFALCSNAEYWACSQYMINSYKEYINPNYTYKLIKYTSLATLGCTLNPRISKINHSLYASVRETEHKAWVLIPKLRDDFDYHIQYAIYNNSNKFDVMPRYTNYHYYLNLYNNNARYNIGSLCEFGLFGQYYYNNDDTPDDIGNSYEWAFIESVMSMQNIITTPNSRLISDSDGIECYYYDKGPVDQMADEVNKYLSLPYNRDIAISNYVNMMKSTEEDVELLFDEMSKLLGGK